MTLQRCTTILLLAFMHVSKRLTNEASICLERLLIDAPGKCPARLQPWTDGAAAIRARASSASMLMLAMMMLICYRLRCSSIVEGEVCT